LGGEFLLFLENIFGKKLEINFFFWHVRCVFHQKIVTFVKIKKIGGGGEKQKKKSSGSNYYCFLCWPDWKTWVAFEIRMLPLLAFV